MAITIQKFVRKNLETCPICLENFFHVKTRKYLSCGHSMQMNCFAKLQIFNNKRCPICRTYVEQLKNNIIDQIVLSQDIAYIIFSETIYELRSAYINININ